METMQERGASDSEQGGAMVEFALIVPVLLLIVFGIINFGYLFGQQLALNQSVRAGARGAVVSGTGQAKTTDEVLALVKGAAQGSLISDSDAIDYQRDGGGAINVDTGNYSTCSETGVGQNLQVKVTYPTKALIPLFIPGFDEFDLKAEAVFRCEW